MLFCPHCGKPAGGGAAFCKDCGARLLTRAVMNTVPHSYAGVQHATPRGTIPASQHSASAQSTRGLGKVAKAILVTLVVFALLSAVAAVITRLSLSPTPAGPGDGASRFPSASELGTGWERDLTSNFRCDGQEHQDLSYVNTTVFACEEFINEVKPGLQWARLSFHYLVWDTEANAHDYYVRLWRNQYYNDTNSLNTMENLTVGDESFLKFYAYSEKEAVARSEAVILRVKIQVSNMPFEPSPEDMLALFVSKYHLAGSP